MNEAYLHRSTHETATLLVWFGGLNEPFLSENVCRTTKADLLSIRDERQDWYTDGIVGVGNREDSARWLLSTAKQYARVFFAGQSSGGYGALRYAYDVEPTACFAFSPTVRNLGDYPPIPVTDLFYLYNERGVNFPIVLNVGRSEDANDTVQRWHDFEQIEDLRRLDNVTTIVHPVDVHYVSVALHRQQRFYSLLKGLMAAYG